MDQSMQLNKTELLAKKRKILGISRAIPSNLVEAASDCQGNSPLSDLERIIDRSGHFVQVILNRVVQVESSGEPLAEFVSNDVSRDGTHERHGLTAGHAIHGDLA